MKLAILTLLGLVIALLLAVFVYQDYRRFHKPQLTTSHHAVTLTNGRTYYGRVFHLETDRPVLRDVLSVQQEIDAATQQPKYLIEKLRDTINGADHMILVDASILHVEPVQPDSAIGKLIAQSSSSR